MSNVIRIPQGLYERLANHASGFDTPVNVIERLLNHYEGIDPKPEPEPVIRSTVGKDNTKYEFNGETYGKGRLVLAVVVEYINHNPDISLDELCVVFPDKLQGSRIGVFNTIEDIESKYVNKRDKRHYLADTDIIQLKDCVVAVCTQWGAPNIAPFLQQAELLGYSINKING